jgi:hypothetical protein
MQNGNGYQGFGDMIDGGGAGRSGQSFEGGGLLSMIANMIARPRGSQQRQQEPMGGLLSTQPQARPAMPMQPQAMQPQFPNTPPPGFQPPTQNPHPQMFQPPMQPPMQYSGRGSVGMPSQPPISFEEFVMGLGPYATTTSPDVLREAYRLEILEGYRP